ncbi:liver-enriched gene 1, tandem duplicate 1 [Myxocyprinus asiaticus]|uniref:liver-enriched gene 1, tandem duplicate 1 n=1 Tax=Myxocyprinus asiaticus TaxID=70543 RepID=UPI00222381BA|nr:liver-enriched gene 1, tandem duplicate 1 [Myxocyprinus asiaticus]
MHFIKIVVAVILSAVLCQAAVVTENGLPILWEKAPSQLSELPTADGVIQVNPWDYLQRMALYKVLINSTNPYMRSMGPGSTENPMWSLPLQLGWKLRSGRLTDPTLGSTSTCGLESSEPVCISPQSWYACINYYMSVLPFLAAVQTGIVGKGEIQVHIHVPAELAQDYCSSFTECSTKYPDAMTKWQTFFKSLQQMSESEDTDFDKKDKILGLMWAAEEDSQTASFACSEKQKLYSSPEVQFGESWLNSAAYVAAAHFHSNIEKSEKFMDPLPSRVLQESDSPPNIADLSAEENHTLYIFSWMTTVNRLLGGSLVNLWRGAMCSPQAREKGQALLHNLILDPKFPSSSLMSILTEMATSC